MTYQYAGSIFHEMDRKITEFTVTEDHLKLAKMMYVGWDDMEFGAPAIDGKRPYGNSDVVADIAEILGIDTEADRIRWQNMTGRELDEGEITDPLAEHLTRIHAEMGIVLQIALVTGEFKAGRYVKPERYGVKWELAL